MQPGHLLTLAYLIPIPGTETYELPMETRAPLSHNETEKVASHSGPAKRPVGSSDVLGGQTYQHKREHQQDQRKHGCLL